MSKRMVGLIGVLLLAAALLAHEGHQHQVLGTVERIRECHLVVRTQEGETKTIFLGPATRFERGAQAATRQDVKAGSRVSIAVENDGETATTIKIGGGR